MASNMLTLSTTGYPAPQPSSKHVDDYLIAKNVYFALNHEHIMQKYIYIIENDFQTGKSGSYRAVNLSSGSSPQTFEISLIALESHLFADYMAVQLFDILFAPSPRVLVLDPFFVRTKERTWTAGN